MSKLHYTFSCFLWQHDTLKVVMVANSLGTWTTVSFWKTRPPPASICSFAKSPHPAILLSSCFQFLALSSCAQMWTITPSCCLLYPRGCSVYAHTGTYELPSSLLVVLSYPWPWLMAPAFTQSSKSSKNKNESRSWKESESHLVC